jgi:hypothetical protein
LLIPAAESQACTASIGRSRQPRGMAVSAPSPARRTDTQSSECVGQVGDLGTEPLYALAVTKWRNFH